MAVTRTPTQHRVSNPGSPDAIATDGNELPPPPARRERGLPYSEERDWGKIGGFGAGLVVGVLIGAGMALFLAPQTGKALRAGIRRGAGRMRSRADDAFDDLREQLRIAARRARRNVKRGARDVAWKAEDVVADVKR